VSALAKGGRQFSSESGHAQPIKGRLLRGRTRLTGYGALRLEGLNSDRRRRAQHAPSRPGAGGAPPRGHAAGYLPIYRHRRGARSGGAGAPKIREAFPRRTPGFDGRESKVRPAASVWKKRGGALLCAARLTTANPPGRWSTPPEFVRPLPYVSTHIRDAGTVELIPAREVRAIRGT